MKRNQQLFIFFTFVIKFFSVSGIVRIRVLISLSFFKQFTMRWYPKNGWNDCAYRVIQFYTVSVFTVLWTKFQKVRRRSRICRGIILKTYQRRSQSAGGAGVVPAGGVPLRSQSWTHVISRPFQYAGQHSDTLTSHTTLQFS